METFGSTPGPVAKVKEADSARSAPDQSAVIGSLLAEAEKNLKAYRLTSPEDNCAYFYFKEVLRLDAKNKTARQGIRRIGNAYGRLADKEISHFQYSQAKEYVSTGLSIVPDHSYLTQIKMFSGHIQEAGQHGRVAVKQASNQGVDQVWIENQIQKELVVLAQALGHFKKAVRGYGSPNNGIFLGHITNGIQPGQNLVNLYR